MQRFLLPFLTFLAFVAESTIAQAFIPDQNNWSWILVPHFALVLLLFMAIYLNTSYSLTYGLIFGLLADLTYTNIIGVYMFATAFTIYIVSVLSRYLFRNIIVTLFLNIAGVSILELIVYGLNRLIGLVDMPINDFFSNRLLPTLIFNAAFAIIVYYPTVKHLNKMRDWTQVR